MNLATNNDIYQRVTDRIIEQIETGTPPWVRPWSVVNDTAPINIISDRAYRGINNVMLQLEAQANGYPLNRWCTYRQAAERGAQVRKGESATQIMYYQLRKIAATGDAFPVYTENDIPERTIPLLRVYSVFNVAQIDGLPTELLQVPVPATAFAAQEAADDLLLESAVPIHHGGFKAFYSPAEDRIQLPVKTLFKDAGNYYAAALHELVHATGHASRCNRQLTTRFGTESYAAEELIAELGAAFLCAHVRIDGQLQHASYISSWLDVLRRDKRAIFIASTKAQQAADWLIAKTQPVHAPAEALAA